MEVQEKVGKFSGEKLLHRKGILAPQGKPGKGGLQRHPRSVGNEPPGRGEKARRNHKQ
jgi:hypothetical protein